jgi:hypothetical protein
VNILFFSLKLDNFEEKMKRLSVQLFLVVILAMAVNADWKIGDNGLTEWDFNCDFNDPTFRTFTTKPSLPEQCGGVCIANPSCIYFVHRDGVCFLKTGPGGSGGRDFSSVANCGFVRNRI